MKSWQRYILVFILSFTLIVFLRRVIPCDDIKDGNLLVNLVLASFLTGCFMYLANLEYPFFGNLNFPTLLVCSIYIH